MRKFWEVVSTIGTVIVSVALIVSLWQGLILNAILCVLLLILTVLEDIYYKIK